MSRAGEVVNQAKNIYSLMTGAGTSATKQQNAYQTFYQMWLSRQLCSVETPWGVINNMAIESMRVLQKDNTNLITDFEIVFKQINVVQTKFVPSLGILNVADTGQIIAANPTIVPNSFPITPTDPSKPKSSYVPIDPTTKTLSGRLQTMLPAPVPLGSTVGVLPAPTMTLPKLMPPVFIPGLFG